MAEFRLERFKYNWKGDWSSGTNYKRDDIVRVNGKSYVCILTHTASGSFSTDLLAILPGSNPPQPQPKWTVMTNGKEFIGNYTTGIDYNIGDIVLYDGVLWICVTPHFSSGTSEEAEYWEVFADNLSFIGDWQPNTVYGPSAVVKYNGINYKNLNAHTSGQSINDNIEDWEEFFNGVQWSNTWLNGRTYRKNDLVKYGGTIFRCIEEHTASGSFDNSKFTTETPGFQFDNLWNEDTYYNEGDVVRHEGFVYYAIKNNTKSRPYQEEGSTDWILLSRSYNFVGDWSVDGLYKTGDVVLRGGNLYTALRDIGGPLTEQVVDPITENILTVSTGIQDGSSLDYLQTDVWELLVPGKSWKGNWTIESIYSVGDVVYYKGSAYTCNFEHVAEVRNNPGDNGNGFDYWDILFQAGQPAGLQEKGDILTYGLSREIEYDGSTIFDDSSLGDTRVRIGDEEQVLSVNSDLEVYWRNIIEDAEQVFVSTNGIDDFNRGSFQKPFKTIKYAAEYVNDNFVAGTPVIIRVSAGKYEEIAPIIVPKGCAINGDELRSTTVLANSPIQEYQNDYTKVKSYIGYLKTIILDILTQTEIEPQAGNTQSQVLEGFGTASLESVNNLISLLDDFIQYADFRLESGSEDVTVVGSNILSTNDSFLNVQEGVVANRDFIQQEILWYLKNTYPTDTFNEERVKSDVWSILRGLGRDSSYEGNYATILAAKRYVNAVNGSQLENLFYMRDSTGLRDLTTGGLSGVLNPPGVFDLYQKPTGGALVSLDPGWGPDDDRTWITNRSPYIQGVTNTGTSCVGMKVDGNLHNGGNRSMTANDFTQVLSDGIGAWITNNGRAELVSVFTYYCQIGYFAEDGGIIRSTNGNNSYGRYGSIADGGDDTEIPQNATIFTRNNEALVEEAIAGGANDEILLFEYSHTGEEYFSAGANIAGAGSDADTEYTDFRDGALFQARLTSPDGSSDSGGAGYLTRQGTAQETADASSSLILSQTDVTQQLSEINGMRILITKGLGVGQYGYIDNFDFNTKTVTVRKDSDGTLGWDHVIPGTPLVSSFDLTTGYRIEPRVVASEPPFTHQPYNLFTNREYVDVEYGDTTETYNNITNSSRVLWLSDDASRITVASITSNISVQFNARLAGNPIVPFTIEGRTTGTRATVTAITANTGDILEANLDTNGTLFQVGEELDIINLSGTGDTFDSVPVAAVFTVVKQGKDYAVSITNAGAGYKENDVIKIEGNLLGGSSPDNDLTITVTSVSTDSSSSIQTISTTGIGANGRFVSLTDTEYARYSNNGQDWVEVSLPFSATNGGYKRLVTGNNKFIAIANNESRISSSLNGISWTSVDLPLAQSWIDGIYGDGKFIIIGNDTDIVLSSTDGITWSEGYIPNDTVGDSTISQWGRIIYGKGKYLAVSQNDRATATSTDGVNWTRHDQALPDLSPAADWSGIDLAYGRNRFVITDSAGRTAYSFDGITWYTGNNLPSIAGTWSSNIKGLKYGQGVFVVLAERDFPNESGTDVLATSEDGITWTQRNLTTSLVWTALASGKINGESKFVILSSFATTDAVEIVSVGARAILRANVTVGVFDSIKIWDSGSGYDTNNLPVITITDPNATIELSTESRIGNGVLTQPEFINRGTGYRSSSSIITITGNGFADIIPDANTLVLSGITTVPSPGVQIRISGILDPTTPDPTDLFPFSGVEVVDLGDDGTGNKTRKVQFTISPRVETYMNLVNGTTVTLREKYSQCRISGHDFLDIGTGNFETTNYPEIYTGGNFFQAAPENEVLEQNGGRVFYVSTDQDGNFRTGELFSVQQATGIVTISAEFFDLDGLSELSLGGVRLGGSGTVVNEFSTDPTFAADSNNVIPTQRAIVTFLADRLSVGGENLEVNRLQAGRVIVGGEANEIGIATDDDLTIPVDVSFDGTYTQTVDGVTSTRVTQISGTIVSQMIFLKQFDETMQ